MYNTYLSTFQFGCVGNDGYKKNVVNERVSEYAIGRYT